MSPNGELVEAVFRCRKGPIAYVLYIGGNGRCYRIASGEEILAEFGTLTRRDAQHVVQYQDLAVAMRAGTDAYGRDRYGLGDLLAQSRRYALEHDDGRPSCFDRLRFLDQTFGCLLFTALNAETAELVYRLRRQPQVSTHRNRPCSERIDAVQHVLCRTLDLDHRRTALAYQACTSLEHVRHVAVSHER